MIKTKQYSISKKEYTRIILLKRLKKYWWLYLSILVLGLFHFKQFGEDSFSTFFSIFAFAYPLITFAYLYFWTNSKGHKPVFSETDLLFDNDYLYFKRNGNETKLNPNSIQKVISKPNYWMLYISKGQFIYIPKYIFYTDNDFDRFSSLINNNR